MTDKYALIIQCLETPKLSTEIMQECDIKVGTIPTMLFRLLAKGMITRERIHTPGVSQKHYLYSRLVESTTSKEVFAKDNQARVLKQKEEELSPYGRYVAEAHPYSEKKKSPRVYVGCSFGLSGW